LFIKSVPFFFFHDPSFLLHFHLLPNLKGPNATKSHANEADKKQKQLEEEKYNIVEYSAHFNLSHWHRHCRGKHS
jgi:hypothetical protein